MFIFSLFAVLASADEHDDCPSGQRWDGSACTDICNLFTVSCAVDTGFAISINSTCKNAQYGFLPADNSGIFIYATDLDANPTAISDPATDLSAGCLFDSSGSASIGWSECGSVVPYTPNGEEYLSYKTYANHRIVLNGITSSMMDQVPVECQIRPITLSSDSADVADTDESDVNDAISTASLVTEFDLELAVGTMRSGSFVRTVEDIDIGKEIRVKLLSIATTYYFALFDCKASSGGNDVLLYDDHCPNAVSQRVNMEWIDYTTFDISVFKLSNQNSLTFSCLVKLYPEENLLPASCANDGRKRRAIGGTTGQTTDIVKRDAGEENAGEESPEVSVTIRIKPQNSTNTYSRSGIPAIELSVALLAVAFMIQ